MQKPTFVYKTYIDTTPERLWQALTEPAFTKRYWNTTLESEWKVGSTITWDNNRCAHRGSRQGSARVPTGSPLVVPVAHLHA